MKLDSKVISVQLRVNPDRSAYPDDDDVDTSVENELDCATDPNEMKYNPVQLVFLHLDRQTSRRKLLWHGDELQTSVGIACGKAPRLPE